MFVVYVAIPQNDLFVLSTSYRNNMSSGKKKIGKYIFTLENINIEEVYKTYGIPMITGITITDNEYTEPLQDTITRVDDLVIRSTDIVTFLDEMKHPVKCIPVMIDLYGDEVTEMSDIDCMWCRHSYDTRPIGCPIRYVAHQVVKTFYSEISKDKFTIREKIPKSKKDRIAELQDKTITIHENDYYETDGIFCSFNCCKAFIEDNKHDPMYDNSSRLLIQMYNDIFNTKTTSIIPADSWRILKNRGNGHLTIEKFRENFNHVSYKYHGYIKNKMHPITHLFEQKLKF